VRYDLSWSGITWVNDDVVELTVDCGIDGDCSPYEGPEFVVGSLRHADIIVRVSSRLQQGWPRFIELVPEEMRSTD
jgi:hypothetical protein